MSWRKATMVEVLTFAKAKEIAGNPRYPHPPGVHYGEEWVVFTDGTAVAVGEPENYPFEWRIYD